MTPLGLNVPREVPFASVDLIPNSSGVWKVAQKHFANPDGFHPSGQGG